MKKIIIASLFLLSNLYAYQNNQPLKVLHVSFHKGCIREFKFIAQELNLNLTSLFVHDLPSAAFDGEKSGAYLYNIGHKRAQKIWNKHKDYFNQFDVILTSDTAPLSRIFLQNNWRKPLIIWVCNRFDYTDTAHNDCRFPDPEYYQLIKNATNKPNVFFASYNAFEYFYAQRKGINWGNLVIPPSGKFKNKTTKSLIPTNITKEKTFFVPPYLNDASVNVVGKCKQLGIPCYRGRYNGPADLERFKGIIHIPYAWSNLALFENTQLGLSYFVPSQKFMLQLLRSGKAWWPDKGYMYQHSHLSEWYNQANKDLLIYFDSWQDLQHKINTLNFDKLKENIKIAAQKHQTDVINKWQHIFDQAKDLLIGT